MASSSSNIPQVTTLQQCQFFNAIEENNIELVKQAIKEGVDINVPSRSGTALYRSVKQHNFELTKLLVDKGADCNTVHLNFNFSEQYSSDPLRQVCFFNTPIDLLCKENQPENDKILQYLLENRSVVNEDMINQRIEYCKRLSCDKNQETLFDYVTSCFLRQNMYDHLYPLDPTTINTLVMATLNVDATLNDKPLNKRASHEAFFTIMIRSLFEELVHFNPSQDCNIKSQEQYTSVLRELLHNLETYHFIKNLDQLPDERCKLFYPFIVKNLIKKLKNMKNKEEYTLPMQWQVQWL